MSPISRITRIWRSKGVYQAIGKISERSFGRRASIGFRRIQKTALGLRAASQRPRLRHRFVSRQDAFLAAFQKTGSIRAASIATGVTPNEHYHWIEKDADYWEEFQDLQQWIMDELRDRVSERAVEGWEEPVFYRGQQCGTIRRKSDRLLLMLLKALMPEKYR